ncbi:MAG TPA: metalloregulator ArsR/SmtB family transcription factor [Rhodothermales bacterium]|nr:metalloregulator ArsR/SmtB family transcription factor [Rhodothermales bacterium]
MSAPIQNIDAELLAHYCKAMGHPVRVQIINILKDSEQCDCGDIVDQLPLAQSTVSQHLKVLKDAGLIRGNVVGTRTLYSLNPKGLTHFKKIVDHF